MLLDAVSLVITVIEIATNVYKTCRAADEYKGTLKRTEQKMGGLIMLLGSFPQEFYQQKEVPIFLQDVNDHVDQILVLVDEAAKYNKLIYVFLANQVKSDIDQLLSAIDLSLQSLDIAQSNLLYEKFAAWNQKDDPVIETALENERVAWVQLQKTLQIKNEELKREKLARIADITTANELNATLQQAQLELSNMRANSVKQKTRQLRLRLWLRNTT